MPEWKAANRPFLLRSLSLSAPAPAPVAVAVAATQKVSRFNVQQMERHQDAAECGPTSPTMLLASSSPVQCSSTAVEYKSRLLYYTPLYGAMGYGLWAKGPVTSPGRAAFQQKKPGDVVI